MSSRRQLQFTVDRRQALAILSELKDMPDKMDKAELTAIRRTAKTAKTRIVRGFTKQVNLKRSEVNDRVKTIRHPRKGSAYAVVSVSKFKISLWHYSRSMADVRGFQSQRGVAMRSRKPRQGAGWKIWKDGKRVRNRRYVATFGKRDRQARIIKRNPLSTNSGMRARAPEDYRTAYGPSLAWLATRRKIVEPVLDEIAPVLEKNLRSQVNRFLQRKTTNA